MGYRDRYKIPINSETEQSESSEKSVSGPEGIIARGGQSNTELSRDGGSSYSSRIRQLPLLCCRSETWEGKGGIDLEWSVRNQAKAETSRPSFARRKALRIFPTVSLRSRAEDHSVSGGGGTESALLRNVLPIGCCCQIALR